MSKGKIPKSATLSQNELGYLYGITGFLGALSRDMSSRIWQSARTQHNIKTLERIRADLWEMLESKCEEENHDD